MLQPAAALPGSTSSATLHTAPSSSSIVATLGAANAPVGESKHPQQLTNCTVSSSGFSNQGVHALPDGASGLLPVGTIIMPANDNLPPGSLVLPQGNLPGGQLRLALPSQLPLLHPEASLTYPPSHRHTSAAVAAANSSLQDVAAALVAKHAPSRQQLMAMGDSHKAQSSSCATAPYGAHAAASQPAETVSCSQLPHSNNPQAAPRAASMPGRGQRACGAAAKPGGAAADEVETDGVSVTASEGTSMLGELLLLLWTACTQKVSLGATA